MIASVDPSHRIDPYSWPEAGPLIRAINKLADRHQAACNRLGDRTPPARKGSEESDILTAFISEMPEGVLACNAAGQLLLFNRRARQFLSGDEDGREPNSKPLLARGNFITTLVDKHLVEHALEEINEKLNRKVLNAVSHFIFEGRNKHILRSRIVPVLDRLGRFTGFILTLSDITDERESNNRVDALLQSLSKSARSPLASIRAASEAMYQYPGLDENRLQQFKEILYKESSVLTSILNKVSSDYSNLKRTKRSFTPVPGDDLVETIRMKARDRLGMVVHTESIDSNILVKADTYSLLNAILFVLNMLKNETGCWEFRCILQRDQKFAMLDLLWSGAPVRAATIRQWENQYLVVAEEKSPLTLKEVLDHHEAAALPYAGPPDKDQACLRFILPMDERVAPPAISPVTNLPDSRAEFYNVDLFGESGSNPQLDLDDRLLTELRYTVLIREVYETNRVEEIKNKHVQLWALMHGMITSGAKVRNLIRLITTFSDAVLKKMIGFVFEDIGPPPVQFAFMTFGSVGRKEQTLKTDQDNAIIYEDGIPSSGKSEAEVRNYFLRLGDRICNGLDQAGYAFCSGGVMAKTPQWCQPLSVWKRYFSSWILAAEPEDLLHASIFFDFKFAYGDRRLVDSLSRFMFDSLQGWSGFFRHLADNSLYYKPPIGFFGNFIVAPKGERHGCLNIKHAMIPIVDFARIYALKNNITETNTQERLYHLYLKRILSKEEYNEIEQAYDFMMQIRFAAQIKAVVEGNKSPDNCINPKKLSTIEQKMLKEIFKRVEKIQAKLSLDFLSMKESH